MDKSQKRQNYLHYIKIKLFSRFNINNDANRAKKHSLERKKTSLNMYASLLNCLVNINLLTMTTIISTSEVILISMGFWRYLFSPGLKYRYLPLFRSLHYTVLLLWKIAKSETAVSICFTASWYRGSVHPEQLEWNHQVPSLELHSASSHPKFEFVSVSCCTLSQLISCIH